MTPDPSIMAFAIPAVLFAGVSKGGFGSGGAFAAAPLLAVVLSPVLALGMMLPLLMLMDVVSMKGYWRGWHTPSAIALIIGSLPGIALAGWFSTSINPDSLRVLIGAIALAFVLWQFAGRSNWLNIPPWPFTWRGGVFTGVVAGFTSFVSHAGGPPVAVFLLAQRMDKTTYQATSVIVFWAVNIIKVIPYTFLGFFTAESLTLDLWLAPVAILGAMLGIKAHHLVPERVFFTITYVLLLVTGTKLIWDGLT